MRKTQLENSSAYTKTQDDGIRFKAIRKHIHELKNRKQKVKLYKATATDTVPIQTLDTRLSAKEKSFLDELNLSGNH